MKRVYSKKKNVNVEVKKKERSKLYMFFYAVIKRLFDLIVSIIGVIFLIPIALVIKIIYMFDGDFTSIIYTQDRIGKNGKIFKLYKFRSMIPNADEVLEKLLKENKELAQEYKINKKLSKDPRITRVGNFIRRFSIDETAQFINVLIGNMSVIGNRPYLPKEKEDMGERYKTIVKTKPGITGYWQVSGRNDTTFLKRTELEEYYSLNASLGLDIKIFFKTFGAVLGHRGAK